MTKPIKGKPHYLVLVLATFCLVAGACSAIPPTETGGPRANQPIYPVLLPADPQRREATLAAARQLIGQVGSTTTDVNLQPITGTIHSLVTNASTPVYLPKLGAAAEMSEEETRESLRRFIAEWQNIIGANPEHLSLVNRTDQPDGTKTANYEQRPFRYPLRGDFGKLQIRFSADRRVLNITSTCIPNADRLQAALSAVAPTVKPEDAVKFIAANGISYNDASGQRQIVKPAATDINPRELVFHVVSPTTGSPAIEFHLAWEIELRNSPVKTVYLDAVKSEVLATT